MMFGVFMCHCQFSRRWDQEVAPPGEKTTNHHRSRQCETFPREFDRQGCWIPGSPLHVQFFSLKTSAGRPPTLQMPGACPPDWFEVSGGCVALSPSAPVAPGEDSDRSPPSSRGALSVPPGLKLLLIFPSESLPPFPLSQLSFSLFPLPFLSGLFPLASFRCSGQGHY